MRGWLRLHAHAAREAMRRLATTPAATATSLLVLALAMLLPMLGAIALRNALAWTSGFEAEPHLDVFMAAEATPEDVRAVEKALRAAPEARRVRFVPRDEALRELRASSHLAEVLATLDRNPLPDAFTVRVASAPAERLAALRDAWAKLPKVDQVSGEFEWSERLRGWLALARTLLTAAGLLLAIAVLFIVGHLITLQVLTHKEEIEVSRLLGATSADVRRPFLYHGVVQALLAGMLAWALAWACMAALRRELPVLTSGYGTELTVLSPGPTELVVVLSIAALLGFLGASGAVRRELRKISPAP